jgi:EAL domain-containing protein (putative c-di-GMP-specific phosphodiesterase class I)
VTALQTYTAGRLLTGLFWALGAVCGTALTTILARVVAPEAGLGGAILCAILAALILRDVTPKASAITPPSAPAIDKGHLSLTHDLNSAFDNQEIRPHFQPQVSLKDGQITGMEALARWHHPAHGMVAPLAFLSSVAQAQLWHKLTDTILHQSLSAIRDLQDAGIFIPQVGVNFAQADLEHPQLMTRILWALDQFDLQPNRLSIEVLENVVVQDAASPVRHSVNSLAKLGCHIDLDDFGTAQNPFDSLRQLNIDRMKIDRSFVYNIDRDAKKQDMLAAVVLLAQRLNLDTIAEGIETDAELGVVQKLGCGHAQGYGIGRPMPLDQLQNWARQYQQTPRPHASPVKLA